LNSILDNVELILGPPGTGKTTTLLNAVSEQLAKGVPPESIGFVAFTRKASNEAKDRAISQFNLADDRLPYFRTLHSLCFRLLGLDYNQLMKTKDYHNVADLLGLEIHIRSSWEDHTSVWGSSEGDRLFFLEQLTRMRMCELRETFERELQYDVSFDSLKLVSRCLKEYKAAKDLADYNDLLSIFIERGQAPSLRLLIVDEAQDLSALQWKVVEKLAASSDTVMIAGDDDQAIFRWAGADIEQFINLPTPHVRTLNQSYRVPSSIGLFAQAQIERVTQRRPKVWRPRNEEGYLAHDTDLDYVNFNHDGTWLILARNQYLLQPIQAKCINEGLPYESSVDCLIAGSTGKAIRAWNRLLDGSRCSVAEALSVYDLMYAKEGYNYGSRAQLAKLEADKTVNLSELVSSYGLKTTQPWHKSLTRMSPIEANYFRVLELNGKLDVKPNIKLSTIHGAKGGEADHVLLVTDMAGTVYESLHSSSDDEHRVWYVALTRAKKSLGLLKPKTSQYIEFNHESNLPTVSV
jgi:DNA helicase-2/ATP-dependent DNA helicase PcrA